MRSLPLLLVLAACVSDKEADVLQGILDASFGVEAPEGIGICHDGSVPLTGTIDARYAGQELGTTVTVGEATLQEAVAIGGDGSWSIDIGEQAVCAGSGGCTLDITVVMETTDELDDGLLSTSGSTTLTLVDDGTQWLVDADGDGFGGTDTVSSCTGSAPPGATDVPGDCDDTAATRNPDATEQCNGLDDDCDTVIDNDLAFVDYFPDRDGDGYGDEFAKPSSTCDGPPADGAWVTDATDCNDDPKTGSNSYPGADEVCDGGEDNNCDGFADDLDQDDLIGTPTYYLDEDGDSYFTTDGVSACTPPNANYTEKAPAQGDADCDDTDADVNPGELEVCDGIDNDCDTFVDDDDPSTAGAPVWHTDADDDGIAPANYSVLQACVEPDGFSAPTGLVDCDDSDASLNPLDVDQDGADTCYSVRLDCDDNNPDLNQIDVDGDGWSTCDDDCDDTVAALNPADADNDSVSTCDGDCDDNANGVSPLAVEIAGDLIDQDCDTFLDCFVDGDGDSFGGTQVREDAAIDGIDTCATVPGVSSTSDDCDDTDPTISPTGTELVGNNVDEDCDTRLACYEDGDNDGRGSTTTASITADVFDGCDNTLGLSLSSDDCDDSDDSIYPGATELVADSTDQSCNGFDACYDDGDNDGEGGTTTVQLGADLGAGESCATVSGVADNSDDCDDADPNINTSETDLVANGIDENCNGFDACYDDGDTDGYGGTGFVELGAPLPGATCASQTGVSATNDDCNDGDDSINPAATEIVVNGVDENCDGLEGCYVDNDGDTFGAGVDFTAVPIGDSCATTGFAVVDGDCDDVLANRYPGADELFCDGIVQDCDQTVDGLVQNLNSATVYTGSAANQLQQAAFEASSSDVLEVCGPDLGGSFDEPVGIALAKSLTIEGHGATLRPTGGARVLEVTGAFANVTLRDLTLDGSLAAAYVGDGGLVYVSASGANLVLDNVDLVGGLADNGGSAAVDQGTLTWLSGACLDSEAINDGGCLHVSDAAVLGDVGVSSVDLTRSLAGNAGGAVKVASGGSLTWNEGTCDGGSVGRNATSGGCLSNDGTSTLDDVVLANANAINGGAVYTTNVVTWLQGACNDNVATGGLPTSNGGCAYLGLGGAVQLGEDIAFQVWDGPDSSGNVADGASDFAFVQPSAALLVVGGTHTSSGGTHITATSTGSVCWTSIARFAPLNNYTIQSDLAVADLTTHFSCTSGTCSADAGACTAFFD